MKAKKIELKDIEIMEWDKSQILTACSRYDANNSYRLLHIALMKQAIISDVIYRFPSIGLN